MNQVELNRQTVAAALSDVYAPSELNLSMEDILQATALHFESEANDLRSKGRRHEFVVPRQVAMYLMRELTSHSYPEIGQFFSGRDHSTVVYAVQKVGEQLAKDRDLETQIQVIKSELL
jgi:chromosomal replication initiator protein